MLFEQFCAFVLEKKMKIPKTQKFIKKYKNIAAPPGEQIKAQASPGMSLCDFEAIGQAVSEKIFNDFPKNEPKQSLKNPKITRP